MDAPLDVAKRLHITLAFEFTFCGGPNIDADIEAYYEPLGALQPAPLVRAADFLDAEECHESTASS